MLLLGIQVRAVAQDGNGAVLFVDADATGAADGTSWTDAFPRLQQALTVAEADDEVWVAEGVYRPTDGGDPTDRTATFHLPNGVALYGGFDGTEATREERDWTVHMTVLSGELGDPDSFFDDSYHVVIAPQADPATVIDGLTIEGASANADGEPDDRGAGLLTIGGSPTLRNCTFSENGAYQRGGAIYVENGSPLIEDCLFDANVAGTGGGVFALGGTPTIRRSTFRAHRGVGAVSLWEGADALIEDVLFEDNEHSALRTRGSSPTVRRTTFRGNSCGPSCGGGGAYLQNGGAPLFEDCLFEGNTAVGGGGAVEAPGVTPTFVRTTFRDNRGAGDVGGAVRLSGNDPDVQRPILFLGCRFERNEAPAGGGLFSFGAPLAVVNTVFAGNRTDFPESGGGAVFVNTAPTTGPDGGPPVVFANAVVVGNEGHYGGGVLLANLPGPAHFVNTTIAGNRALERGGGASTFEVPGLRFENGVFWGNAVPEGAEGSVALFHEAGGAPAAERSLIEGGCPPGVTCASILDADPAFVRPPSPGPDGAWGTADDDYGDLRLAEGSPGTDAGLASLLPADWWDLDGDGDTEEPLPVDLASGPRVVGAGVDLGAYEGAVPVSAEGTPTAGNELTLSAYPNPSRGAVTLRLVIAEAGEVRVTVLDVLGREVAVLHEGPLAAGDHTLALDAERLPAGLYLIRAAGEGRSVTQPMTVSH
jgi:predicted outer membrane repeat protein